MSRTHHPRVVVEKPFARLRAVLLLQQWLRGKPTEPLVAPRNVMKLARALDRSWGYMRSIVDGRTRPDAQVMFGLRTIARIPIDAWRTPDEIASDRKMAKTGAAA